MRTLLLLLCLYLAPQQLLAVTLEWDRNLETNVIGYRVYVGTASRVYDQVLDVSNSVIAVISIPVNVQTFFAVTAYNSDGLESDFSEEVFYTRPPPPIPPMPPTRFRITDTNEIVTLSLESTENLIDWFEIFTTNTHKAFAPRMFYRVSSLAD
jgi:hypothetical protein